MLSLDKKDSILIIDEAESVLKTVELSFFGPMPSKKKGLVNKMKYSMKDVTASYTPEKRKDTSLWARVFSRPLSFPVTYILINLGVSANAVSVISIFVALAACILLACGSTLSWIGVFVFLFCLFIHLLYCGSPYFYIARKANRGCGYTLRIRAV